MGTIFVSQEKRSDCSDGPKDVIGRAMARIGCHLERFLAPVEPGNLFMLGYKDETPIVSAPGCFRSAKLNVIDLVLPPMLARHRVSAWEVAGLGHGGLLAKICWDDAAGMRVSE
jgi:molybdenum cofactor cytidylyltransferase